MKSCLESHFQDPDLRFRQRSRGCGQLSFVTYLDGGRLASVSGVAVLSSYLLHCRYGQFEPGVVKTKLQATDPV
jgi:hypothetical protein